MNESINNFRPTFALYHASPRGTGSAVKMSLHPAHGTVDGCIAVTIANQMTIGDATKPQPVYPRFGFDNATSVNLDFNDLCKVLQVFRGECESIEDGKGIFHCSASGTTKINLRHVIDPVCGYSFEIHHNIRGSGEERSHRFFFNSAEACGLTEAISTVMGFVVFGVPVVHPHE